MCNGLANMSNLKTLDVEGNPIGDEGAMAIAELMKKVCLSLSCFHLLPYLLRFLTVIIIKFGHHFGLSQFLFFLYFILACIAVAMIVIIYSFYPHIHKPKK